MRWLQYLGLCGVFAFTLTGCGGSKGGDQTPRVSYTRIVSFGDSLSDVGAYKVPDIAALGGGEYTVNNGGGQNWTELLAAQLGLAAPCPETTGLESHIPGITAVPATVHNNCYNFAMGGARVKELYGPGNYNLYVADPTYTDGLLGQLTYPIVMQIGNFLQSDSFTDTDLVTVLAGGNDLLMQASAILAGKETPSTANTNMAIAGSELADYIINMILSNGATHVVVVNLPDVSLTPYAVPKGAGAQAVVNGMVQAFNSALAAGLSGTSDTVLLVDAYTQSQDQYAHPVQYGLTNVTTPACDYNKMALKTSLVCSTSTTLATDVSHYEYADDVHPTPYGYQLLTSLVTTRMAIHGWL